MRAAVIEETRRNRMQCADVDTSIIRQCFDERHCEKVTMGKAGPIPIAIGQRW
jgi:hypothetical protein